MGAVGAYDWSGGLILKSQTDGSVRFLNESSATAAKYSYLGETLEDFTHTQCYSKSNRLLTLDLQQISSNVFPLVQNEISNILRKVLIISTGALLESLMHLV